MANRDTRFLIKRSNVPGKIPTNGDLLLGELGLNTSDAILYTSGTTANSILPIGWDRVSRTGDTMTGGLFTPFLSATTISATTYYNLPTFTGDYLPLSGGTVYGPTIYSSGLTANTLNVTGLTQTSGITSTGGIIFPQKTLTSSYTATTADYFLNISGGTLDVTLMSAIGIQGKLLVVKNEGSGIVNVISQFGELIDDRTDVLLTQGNSVQLISDNENWVIIGYNISSTQANTGVVSFSGLSIASPITFNVAPVKGFIVDDATNPTIPFLTYVTYSGGVHTATYVNTDTATWVYLTSGGTISQTNIPLTDQQRRQNILLGKLGHANKTSIINAFSQPDFVLSPLSQLRDMFDPINLINAGIRPSANGANLSFNTSSGYLHGLGINFANDTLNPNAIYVTGTSPCTFQYRTQTGGTASNTTFIDPTKYDVGGVVTSLSGTKATNQRIYLVQNGVIRVQYGQTEYSNLTQAIVGLSSEPFVEFTNFTTNGILIGILSVLSSASDLTDTSKAQFFNVSKFGDASGAAGGSPTTNLQQAYNNSVNPEIVINSTLDGLSIKNGTGNADNVTRLLEGQTSTNGVTSFIRADGYISGTTFQSNGFIANSNGLTATTVSATTLQTSSFTANSTGLSATTVSATTYYNLPSTTFTGGTVTGATRFTNGLTANTISATTYFNLPTDIRVTGGTYSSGSAIFRNNTGGTFNVTGFSTGNTTLYWYDENNTPPATAPIASGTGSIALGDGAQALSSNMFVYGQNAGNAATNATGSTFIGYEAGISATNAHYSNFMGYSAGGGAFNANRSNFIGAGAGYNATDASNSNFIGDAAGQGAESASQSNFFGDLSGFLAINAFGSNFLGSNTGYKAYYASYSNFIGSYAGYQSTNAYNSNFIGEFAGYYSDSIHSNFFGTNAGYSATSSNYSNLFGYNAGKSFSGNNIGSNNIIIGTNLSLPNGTANAINIGGVLFGSNTYTTTSGNPFTGATSTGRIGINVVSPTQSLQVSGNTLIQGNLTATTISATTYLNLPTDIRVTGGTYSSGTAVFRNNTGGTFSVTGFSTSTATAFTGGTVTGATNFTGGLTANTISATTYQNLPTDIRVTGASYSNNTFTYTNNTGGTFNTLFNTVTGLTVNGNLSVTGNTSMTGTLSVTGNTNVRAITGTSATISGSGQSILTVIGSGTTTPIFSIQGSSGELFSVTDSLTGSLFSVNDISGLPIVEVFSDNTILMGNYLAPSLNTTAKITLTAGTNTIYSIPTSAYTGAFVDYTVISSGNTSARAGNIMTIWNSGSTQYTEVSTNDIGSTTGITFSTSLSGSNALISASATTAGWTLKTIIRAI